MITKIGIHCSNITLIYIDENENWNLLLRFVEAIVRMYRHLLSL
jgi:hypothetical protein